MNSQKWTRVIALMLFAEAQYEAHPSVAYALLSKIPRLEPIAWMIEHQNQPVAKGVDAEMGGMRLGAEILRLILAYEKSIHQGVARNEAAHMLARQNRNFSAEFFQALVTRIRTRKRGSSEGVGSKIYQRA